MHAMSATEVFLLAILIIFTLPYAVWRLGRTDYWAPLVVVQYARPANWRPNIYAETPAPAAGQAQINLIHIDLPGWMRDSAPQFMYLWTPGS